jgi:hypothetical protein
MTSSVFLFSQNRWISHFSRQTVNNDKVQLVLCFGSKEILSDAKVFASVQSQFESAQIVMCSTAGEIYQSAVHENSLVAVALQFKKTPILTASVNIGNFANSYDAAVTVINKIPKEDLSYVMVFSDGSLVNGSKLVKGLNDATGNNVLVTGGVAGDDINFKSTLVGLNNHPAQGEIVAIGFYGKSIMIGHGSQGGGDTFGIEKEITQSVDNVLHELENQNALDVYKKYLGPEAKNLPGSALLFPLSLNIPGTNKPVVRTILSIDEEQKTMTYAGDVPVGSKIRFMCATVDKIIASASIAAKQTLINADHKPDFALIISCVGRKMLLESRTVDEITAVGNVFGNETLMAGFYSYGEISPADSGNECQLHNQTMTITTFFES